MQCGATEAPDAAKAPGKSKPCWGFLLSRGQSECLPDFAAGTGNPYFTTDTTAALRAAEIGADAILRGTHSGVKGIYTADPKLEPDAELLEQVSYIEVIQQGLQAMDATAITMCRDNDIPIVVFDLMERGNIRSILDGHQIGTLVTQ